MLQRAFNSSCSVRTIRSCLIVNNTGIILPWDAEIRPRSTATETVRLMFSIFCGHPESCPFVMKWGAQRHTLNQSNNFYRHCLLFWSCKPDTDFTEAKTCDSASSYNCTFLNTHRTTNSISTLRLWIYTQLCRDTPPYTGGPWLSRPTHFSKRSSIAISSVFSKYQ